MDPATAHGEYIGATLIEGRAVPALADALEATFTRDPDLYYEDGYQEMVDRGRRIATAPLAGRHLVGRGRRPRRPGPGAGDRVPVLARMLASPLFVDIRRGAVEDLSDLLHERYISSHRDRAGRRRPVPGRRRSGGASPTRCPEAEVFEVKDASLASAGELQQALGERSYDAVVGIGGGRTLDVAKYAATRAAVPMVAVATNLAHDGLCSPVASLEHPHGKGSFGVALPLAVLVDLDYVRAAPPRLVRAGIGDVVSNLSAIADWSLAQPSTAGSRSTVWPSPSPGPPPRR